MDRKWTINGDVEINLDEMCSGEQEISVSCGNCSISIARDEFDDFFQIIDEMQGFIKPAKKPINRND